MIYLDYIIFVIISDRKTISPRFSHPLSGLGSIFNHFIPADQSEETIAAADVLIVTGVTLVNHTLEEILKVARQDAEIAVIGPTASMLPDALFARGVRVVGGVWVKKPDELLDVLAAGGSGYHFFDNLAPRIVIEKES